MKRLFSVGLSLFAWLLFWALPAVAQSADATLEETVSWLEDKIDFVDGLTKVKLKFDPRTQELIYTRVYCNQDPLRKHYYIHRIPVKQINPAEIRIDEVKGYYWVYLKVNPSGDPMILETWFASKGEEKKLVLRDSDTYVGFPPEEVEKTPDLPVKFRNAVVRLVGLCREKEKKR